MDTLLRKLQEFMMDNNHPLKAHRIEARELIAKICGEFKNHLDAYDIQLLHQVKTNEWIMDDDIILKILRYLVSNSIAYHDPEKSDRKIIIKIEANDKGSILEVFDNGIGIPEEQQEKIFDIFYRATENSIGSGMGLFLVKSLAEKAGGSISCQSSVGDGTKIRIYFPKLFMEYETLNETRFGLKISR
jgi:signal transduction histidine kinase